MKHEHLIQCKRVILNNKKSDKFINLTIADKMYLIKLSRRLKKEGNIDKLSFEEFVLLCKQHKRMAVLRLESKYSTTFIDILNFDKATLRSTLFKFINEIELYNDEDKYNNIEDIIYLLQVNNVVLFNTFEDVCKLLNIKITIE